MCGAGSCRAAGFARDGVSVSRNGAKNPVFRPLLDSCPMTHIDQHIFRLLASSEHGSSSFETRCAFAAAAARAGLAIHRRRRTGRFAHAGQECGSGRESGDDPQCDVGPGGTGSSVRAAHLGRARADGAGLSRFRRQPARTQAAGSAASRCAAPRTADAGADAGSAQRRVVAAVGRDAFRGRGHGARSARNSRSGRSISSRSAAIACW